MRPYELCRGNTLIHKPLWQPVSLALEEEIAPLFPDCQPGAVPPVGGAYGLCAVIDDSLENQPEVYFEAGDHQTLVHLTHDGFHRLMRTVPHARISGDGERCRSELHYFGA